LPDFNTAAGIQRRAAVSQRCRFLQTIGFDNYITAQNLPDLNKRSVGNDAAGFKDFAIERKAKAVVRKFPLRGDGPGPVLPFFARACISFGDALL
jgi:hypothetical protein